MYSVARIQAWSLRGPIETPVQTSFGLMQDRPGVLVRIEDTDGAYGFGEVFANWPTAGAEHRVNLLEKDVAPLVLGQSYASPDAMFYDLNDRTRIRAFQCAEHGPFAQVIAGLDIALWDLAARKSNKTLRKFLNPKAPDAIEAYASGIHINMAHEIIPEMRAHGYRNFKVKVGFAMEQDITHLGKIASDLREGEGLACDANQAWSFYEACSFAERTQDIPLRWLEEPMPVYADAARWQALARVCRTPLAGGENLLGEKAFAAEIAARSLKVIQPDVAKWGGITGCRSVAQQALTNGLVYCPHFLGAGIGLAASGELLAAVGGKGLLEVDVNPNNLRQAFFDPGEPISAGRWLCGDYYGIGQDHLPSEFTNFVTQKIDLHCT